MPRFFCTQKQGDLFEITGQDAFHLARSLRCRKGEEITLCDGAGTDYFCVLESLADDVCTARVVQQSPSQTEPPADITLFIALPKGDKLEEIIKAAVPMGVTTIVPFVSQYCVAKPKADRQDKITARLNKIAKEAAGQSQRGILPTVTSAKSWKQLLELAKEPDVGLVFYEKGGQKVSDLIRPASTGPSQKPRIGLFVGAEGGFSEAEIAALGKVGVVTATLGPRILRCELAPTAGLALVLNALGEC